MTLGHVRFALTVAVRYMPSDTRVQKALSTGSLKTLPLRKVPSMHQAQHLYSRCSCVVHYSWFLVTIKGALHIPTTTLHGSCQFLVLFLQCL